MKDMVRNQLKVSMEPSERHGLESTESMYRNKVKDMVWNQLKVSMEPSERNGLESAKSKYGTK